MNNRFKALACGVITAFCAVSNAQAASIAGDLLITGEVIPLPGPDLGDAFALQFPTSFLVTDASDDFAANGLGFGTTGTISSFMPSVTPVAPLIVAGPFTMVLETVTFLEQDSELLNLVGLGTLSAPGFDDTAAEFSLSADGIGERFVYSATLATDITVVPVPGALVLFASGLVALGSRRRR